MERMILVTLLRAAIFLPALFLMQYYLIRRSSNIFYSHNYFNDKKIVKHVITSIIIFLNLFPVFNTIVGIYGVINPATNFVIPKVPWIDYIFLIPSWLYIVTIAQIVLLFAPIDLIFFLLKKIRQSLYVKSEIYLKKYFIILLVFFTAYVPLRAYYEYKNVKVERRVYKLDSLKQDLDNFKIAFISDIQMDRFTNEKRVKNYIDKLNQLNSDLVLAGGDFVTNDSSFIPKVAYYTGLIKSNYGVYSCIGDHDFFAFKKFYWKSLSEIKKALLENNVNMIDNGNVILYVNESLIKITFLSNTYVKGYEEVIFDSLAKSGSNADLKILVTHQPDELIAKKAKEHGYNLYLAGHTHGGQVVFLFPFINLTPVMFETKFIKGDYWFNSLLMIVNRGLGMSTMPIRYHALPEITLIEIKTKNISKRLE